MSSGSYFWVNLGVLQKVGVWTPYYEEKNKWGIGKLAYTIFRSIIIISMTLHAFAECFLICYDLKSLSMEELTVSLAFDIQHVLGIIKVYIIIKQQPAILELDNRTKKYPLFRSDDEKFLKGLRSTVKLSDWIGYIYWFFVLITISFGGATGIWATYHYKHAMYDICQDKIDHYNSYLIEKNHEIAHAKMEAITKLQEMPPHLQINAIEIELQNLNISLLAEPICKKPRKVFPYHVWYPFNATKNPLYFVVFFLNWVNGLLFVLVILPIDLMVMSYLRYIRFQFELLKEDLINLRADSIKELEAEIKNEFNELHEEALTKVQIRRLRKIMHHQLRIYDFFDRTEDLYTWILFGQYLGSAVMICGVLYSLSEVLGDMLTPKFFHVAFFYSGLLFQLYSNCYYGSQVLILSSNIGEFAYFSGWQNAGKYTVKLKPYIMMIMNRSLRPCKLRAGKFAGVDLPTFMSVFKASYTYYNVLVNNPRDMK